MRRPRLSALAPAALAPAVLVGGALAGLALGSGPACSKHDSTYHGPTSGDSLVSSFVGTFNLGETLFDVTRDRMASVQAPDTAAKVAALDARRTDFIASVNAILDPRSLTNLGPTLRALLDLVDDGTIPRMTDNVARILDRALAEPDRRTLKAMVAMGSARTVVQTDDGIAFVTDAVNDPDLERIFEAVAALMRDNDGLDDQGRPNAERDLLTEVLGVLSRLSRTSSQPVPATAGQGFLAELRAELLKPAQIRGSTSFGEPAWVVLADAHGNPKVAIDPRTGRLHDPFVDGDRDGAADIATSGEPVDVQGQAIAIAPFDLPNAAGRDGFGRAITPSGELYYEYIDAKLTLLSHFLQLAGELLRRGLHQQACDLVEIALGARVPSDNQTPADPSDDYLGFAVDGPVVDLSWGLLETWKPEGTAQVQRALAEIARTEPALVEQLLVSLGRILERARPIVFGAAPTPPSAASRQLTDRVLQLFDRVFQQQGAGPSTGRVLVARLHELGRHSRDLPKELALLARYRRLTVDAQGNAGPGSELVDRSLPPTTAAQGLENRSALHQLLALLAHADQCSTFGIFGGKPLSETMLELMAGRSVGTVSSLIDLLQIGLVRSIVTSICPGIAGDLDALDALRASGALDAFLPIAEVFVAHGETRLLIDLIELIEADYVSTVRPYEPEIADLLGSGAFDAFFDLLDLLVAGRGGNPVADPVTGVRAIDAFVDGIAELMRHPAGGVRDRLGRVHPSKIHLLVAPLRAIEDRLHASGTGADIALAFAYNLTDLLAERVPNDAGTADPSDDFEEMRNPSLVPFAARLLSALDRLLPRDSATRVARLVELQRDAEAALTGRDAAAIFDLVLLLRRAPGTDPLRNAAIHLLTPDPTGQRDIFASLLKLITAGIQAEVDTAPLRDLAAFLGEILDPAQQQVTDLVYGANRLLQADRGRVIISLLRNGLNDAPPATGLPQGASPLDVLLDVLDDVDAASQGAPSPGDDLARLETVLVEVNRFIRDRQSGLGRVYDLIRNRPR